MTEKEMESMKWRARFRAARKYGKPFNDPPPTDDNISERMVAQDQFEKEAEKEFVPTSDSD